MRIDFNPFEVQELHDLLSLVCRRAPGENEHLETALKKLRRSGKSRICRHCKSNMSRRKNRLCDPCHSYKERFGLLPPQQVLGMRAG